MNLFEGDLVRLAHIQRENLPTYKRWVRDYETLRLFIPGVITPFTDEAEEEWYENTVKSKDTYTFAIRTLEGDRLIGNCGLFRIDSKNHSAELGILIGEKDYWGKGYGSDALRVLLRFAFDELNLNRVQLWVFAYNQRAIRVYEKIGFVHEGTQRQALYREGIRVYEKIGFVHEGTQRQALYREGKYHDGYIMAILREEWRAQQADG
jgi:RimJ/RimL family protein N-acetyltransferase